jgi:hypothetical protein
MSNGITVVDSFTTEDQINSHLNTLSQKYLANNEYVLSGTNSGVVSAGINALAPYANLSNKYYPSVANIPNASSSLKTTDQIGGYFTPSNLGASVYLTKSITYSINTDQVENGSVYRYIDPSKYNKGRGLTQNDQDNIVSHTVDINWMKSTNTSEYYDGNIINADTYQKFVPYQSAFESTKIDSNGVVNARHDFEFWTGNQKQTWAAVNSATQLNQMGYFDLDARIQNLVYTPGLTLYSWNTDVFGNQYALYKFNSTPHSLYTDMNVAGNLWVKTIDSTIKLGPAALSAIYSGYVNDLPTYSQLTNNTITNFEIFYDTLIIQLTNKVLYEKITFDYNTFTISNSLQNFLPLNLGITNSSALSTLYFNRDVGTLSKTSQVFYGGNWFDSNNKTITICTLLSSTFTGKPGSIIGTSGLSSIVIPVLYRLDLNNPRERVKIFPSNDTLSESFKEYVYPLNKITYMEAPVFCYNEDTNKYIITFIAFFDTDQKMNIINYKVSN